MKAGVTELACQTITWGPQRLSGQYPDVVREVARAGYAGVETNLGVLRAHMEQISGLREETGLQFVAAHSGLRDLEPAVRDRDERARLRADLQAVGAARLLVSHGREDDRSAYTAIGRTLGELQDAVGDLGVQVLFHNHQPEIEHGWEALRRICEAGAARGVGLAVDFGWVLQGGVDPGGLLDALGEHVRYAHFKDFRAGDFTELGSGDIGLDRAAAAARRLHLPWWVAEQDRTSREPLESARMNLLYLRQRLQEHAENGRA